MSISEIWRILKDILNKKERKIFLKKREIWRVHLGHNVGHEQNGSGDSFVRPVLVLQKLNQDTFVILPLTSKNKKGSFYFPIKFNENKSIVVLSQIKVLDKKRFIKKLGTLDQAQFTEVQKKSSALVYEHAVDPEGKSKKL